MQRVRGWLLVVFGLVAGGLSVAPAAVATTKVPTPKVTLNVSENTVVFGDKVQLSGKIRPALAGQQVTVVSNDRIVATDTTDKKGRYSVRFKPGRNKVVRAQWATAISKKQQIRVKPRVDVNLGGVELFEKSRVKGRVVPVEDGRVRVMLAARGDKDVSKRVKVAKDGTFATQFRIGTIAPVQARASYDPRGLARGADRSGYKRPLTPYLTEGSNGRYVKVVEKRLTALGYHLEGVDRMFDYTTRDAVIAFHKVQGLPRIGDVADYTWHALVKPKRPEPVSTDGFHYEIDQTKQVLYIVNKGKVQTIVHTSTGANGYTRDGVWTVHSEIQGYSPGRLYYPSYFDGARGVHGWPEVPTYPASHGCARVPMWIAQWLNSKAYVGMTVRVYHS